MAEDLQEDLGAEPNFCRTRTGDQVSFGDFRVQIAFSLGSGLDGEVFLAENLDGSGGDSVVKVHNPSQCDAASLQRAHALRRGPLASIPKNELIDFLRPPVGHRALLNYVPGDERSVHEYFVRRPGFGVENLYVARDWLYLVLPVLSRMHVEGVTHGDVASPNVVANKFPLCATVVDITHLAGIGEETIHVRRPLYSHPDLLEGGAVPAKAEYDEYAAGMMALTLGIDPRLRRVYMGSYPFHLDDTIAVAELRDAKRDGSFVRLGPLTQGNLEDIAHGAMELVPQVTGSTRDSAIARLSERFLLGGTLIGPDSAARAAALRDPRAFLKAAA